MCAARGGHTTFQPARGARRLYLTCTVTKPPPIRFDVNRKTVPWGENVETVELPVTGGEFAVAGDRAPRARRSPHQLELLKGSAPELDAMWRNAGLNDVKNSIAVPWRAGERRIGAVAVYDSPHGFTAHDLWVLRLFGMAAGLLWQYKESEDELSHT